MEPIKLWEKHTPYFNAAYEQEEPDLTPYLIEDNKVHPCVIVYPGGGYHHRAYHEGEPVAKWLNTIGIHAFVLNYRLAPYTHKAILGDGLRSIRVVRYNAEKWNIDPEKIGVLGFSAGGHLAYMSALRHTDAELLTDDPIDRISSKPDFAIPCYAVASFEKFPQINTANRFLGEEATLDDRHIFSAEQNVTADAPPMFIWHTAEDQVVSVENSLQMALALRAHRVPFALHIYPNGGHGQGMALDIPVTNRWTQDCEKWLYDTLEMEEKG